MNEDIRTKQDLLFEVSSLNTQLSNELIKNEKLQQRIDKAIEYMEHYIKVEELNEPVKVEFKEVMGMLRGEENDN